MVIPYQDVVIVKLYFQISFTRSLVMWMPTLSSKIVVQLWSSKRIRFLCRHKRQSYVWDQNIANWNWDVRIIVIYFKNTLDWSKTLIHKEQLEDSCWMIVHDSIFWFPKGLTVKIIVHQVMVWYCVYNVGDLLVLLRWDISVWYTVS